MERDFSRGLDIFNPDNYKDIKIWIIWAWGIGSNSAYVLSKMWLQCKVCDFDEVDMVNTSSQFYGIADLWTPKVEALRTSINAMCDEDIEIVNKKYEPWMFDDCKILILALDSLKVRKEVIETCKDTQFILDTRMEWKLSEINLIYGMQREGRIEKEWKENADELSAWMRCTEKAVAFNAVAMWGLVWAIVSDFLKGKELKYKYILDFENYQLHTFNS